MTWKDIVATLLVGSRGLAATEWTSNRVSGWMERVLSTSSWTAFFVEYWLGIPRNLKVTLLSGIIFQ